jgi:phospholipid transport system transporter-binding protein
VTKVVEKITLNSTEHISELAGELTRQTVMQISKIDIQRIIAKPVLVIDLQQVTRIDTAGLAWIFYLLEQANAASCQLSFSNVPAKLNKLISLSGVEGFLPLHTTNN